MEGLRGNVVLHPHLKFFGGELKKVTWKGREHMSPDLRQGTRE